MPCNVLLACFFCGFFYRSTIRKLAPDFDVVGALFHLFLFSLKSTDSLAYSFIFHKCGAQEAAHPCPTLICFRILNFEYRSQKPIELLFNRLTSQSLSNLTSKSFPHRQVWCQHRDAAPRAPATSPYDSGSILTRPATHADASSFAFPLAPGRVDHCPRPPKGCPRPAPLDMKSSPISSDHRHPTILYFFSSQNCHASWLPVFLGLMIATELFHPNANHLATFIDLQNPSLNTGANWLASPRFPFPVCFPPFCVF